MTIEIQVSDLLPEANGGQNTLYLDPENRRVYSFSCIGAGVPMTAHNGSDKSLGAVNSATDEASLRDLLEQYADELDEIIGCYHGPAWDGSNHRGKWREEGTDLLSDLYLKLRDALGELPMRVDDVGAYFEPIATTDLIHDVIGFGGSFRSYAEQLESCDPKALISVAAIAEWARERVAEIDDADLANAFDSLDRLRSTMAAGGELAKMLLERGDLRDVVDRLTIEGDVEALKEESQAAGDTTLAGYCECWLDENAANGAVVDALTENMISISPITNQEK